MVFHYYKKKKEKKTDGKSTGRTTRIDCKQVDKIKDLDLVKCNDFSVALVVGIFDFHLVTNKSTLEKKVDKLNIEKPNTSYTNILTLSFNLPPIKNTLWIQDKMWFLLTLTYMSSHKSNGIYCVNSHLGISWLSNKAFTQYWVSCIVVNCNTLNTKQNETDKQTKWIELLFWTKMMLWFDNYPKPLCNQRLCTVSSFLSYMFIPLYDFPSNHYHFNNRWKKDFKRCLYESDCCTKLQLRVCSFFSKKKIKLIDLFSTRFT